MWCTWARLILANQTWWLWFYLTVSPPGVRYSHIIKQASFLCWGFPMLRPWLLGWICSFYNDYDRDLMKKKLSWVKFLTFASSTDFLASSPVCRPISPSGQLCLLDWGVHFIFATFYQELIPYGWDLWTWQIPAFFSYSFVFHSWLIHMLKMTGSSYLDICFWGFYQTPGSWLLVFIELKEGTHWKTKQQQQTQQTGWV